MNKIMTFLSMNVYNTPSKLFLYFLETYGPLRSYEDEIDVCQLTRMTIKAILGCLAVWSIGAALIYVCLTAIAGWGLMLVYQLSFMQLFDVAEPLGAATFGLSLTIAAVLVAFYSNKGINKYSTYRYNKSKEKRKDKDFAPTIFEQWYHAFKNKYCIKIDLDKIRNT